MKSPLAGYRVLTFENFGAGPYGSMFLADLGAEVIKIENRAQGGDATRDMGPLLGGHDSHFFQTFNFNKKSVCLNLKTAAGQAAFRRLAATAQVSNTSCTSAEGVQLRGASGRRLLSSSNRNFCRWRSSQSA